MWLWVLAIAALLILGRKIANPPESEAYFVFVIQPIAQAIARAEGYYVSGSLPARRNNPGSLTRDGVLRQFDSAEDGWQALYRQIESMLSGSSMYYSLDMSLTEIAQVYTGGDKPDAWASIVSSRLGISPSIRWGDVPSWLNPVGAA